MTAQVMYRPFLVRSGGKLSRSGMKETADIIIAMAQETEYAMAGFVRKRGAIIAPETFWSGRSPRRQRNVTSVVFQYSKTLPLK
jgi:hypothetical protein